ncbi:MAG TPA: hypothetical protein VHB93_02070 [Candidatus Paceibacterota bacterium]|nr:hypothetical protein [Candidatus Paceibacterota bacterium]
MSIPELAARSKTVLGRVPGSYFIVAIVLLASTAAFGLGYLEGRAQGQGGGGGVSVTQLGTTTPAFMAAAAAAPAAATTTLPAGGEVVASKTGSKYYLPWCGTVKLIKDENKVWFATREAAEAAGYQPASNCKGL